jgi:tetratricopeptide (TPR) repeat protein
MLSPSDLPLPPPPQTGRTATLLDANANQSRLWSQLLAVFRDLGGSFDPFANDANPQVRALGRLARQRRRPQANDYFALGDLCARLTLQGASLSATYAAKTIAAYLRGGQVAPTKTRTARQVLLEFALWVSDVARRLGDYESLNVGVLVCERVQQLDIVAQRQADAERLRALGAALHDRIAGLFQADQEAEPRMFLNVERESQLLCDQGQMLLRQSQAAEGLVAFERALRLDDQNYVAWIWRAMALTDLGRFDDALESYDRALVRERGNARGWNSKGALLMEIGRIEPALACFDRAVMLATAADPISAVFWLNKGKALFRLGRYQAALDALVQSQRIDPSAESAAGIAACQEQLERLAAP